MSLPVEYPTQWNDRRLADENEQLRASLESALEENTLLVEERDRLRSRMQDLADELRQSDRKLARQEEQADSIAPVIARQGETEEELRVAFEELQVLTEELELANSGLNQANEELDARVAERTAQLKEISEILQATQASLHAVAELVPDLLWRADALGRADWFSRRWQASTGQSAEEALGMGWLKSVHPSDQDATRAAWNGAVGSGKPFEHEFRIRSASRDYRWLLARAEPLRDENGRIVRWFAAGTDIHDQRCAMEALEYSERRFRTLVEGMPQLVWRAVDEGHWTWSSPQWRQFTGQDDGRACGMGWLDAFHPDDRDAVRKAWARAQDAGLLDVEARIFQRAENSHRFFRTRALPVTDAAGRTVEWLGTSTDVDDILKLREQQRVLVAELQHRTRNLMAVVQAVTTRTLRGTSSLDEFENCINDRLSALARVQGILSRRETGSRVAFDLLLREELSAHAELTTALESGRISLEGPGGVPLRSATVQTFALALHELATNAVKYGALSARDGHLRVTWGIRRDDRRGPQLWVDWRETGVSDMPPAGSRAQGGGYGRELIERALPYQLGASTSFELEPDGVHCTIEMGVPAEQVAAEKVDG